MTPFRTKVFGPVAHTASAERVGAFIAATGDDPGRWSDQAPPGYAAVGLVAIAGDLLAEAIDSFGAVVHTRQRFEWEGPLAVGSAVDLSGKVTAVRERSGMTIVDFSAEAPGWVRSDSSFLMAAASAADLEELAEPPATARGDTEIPGRHRAPAAGDQLIPLSKSASRLGIVQYAAASGDWNPIHWDHDSAVAAGLGGVVAHGLLAAAWMAQGAARYSGRSDPLAYLDLRFRRPLRPAAAAAVGGSVVGVAPLELELSVTAGNGALVTGTAGVNE